MSRRLRGDLLDAERITRPALAALLRKSGLDPAPYEHTSRLRACLNQYGLLTVKLQGGFAVCKAPRAAFV